MSRAAPEATRAPASPGLTHRRRYLVLAICCCSLLLVSMDNTIVNVALPSIRTSLHASLAGLQWTIDAYTLTLASLLLLSGSTADKFGRRRTFQVGLATFVAGSLLCSLASSLPLLIAFRVVQAIGGSMLNPVAMSIITNTFTNPRERAQAVGIWGAVQGISLALGPLLGGLLTETVGWPAIFWINVPIGLTALVLAQIFVPESRAARRRAFDPVGQVLVIVIMATAVDAIIAGPQHGWTSTRVITGFGVAALALVALLVVEPRREEPLVDLRFFASAPFSGATVIAVAAFATYGAFLFLGTLYLQDVRGLSALRAGLYLLPIAVASLVVSPLSGRAVGRWGTRPSLIVAGSCMALAMVALTRLTPGTPALELLAIYLVFGIGSGAVNAPITTAAVAGMPPSRAGVAAAFASTSRQIGILLGVAVAGSLVGAAGAALGSDAASGARFTAATHTAWWVCAGTALVVLVVGLVTSGAWARRTRERVGDLVAEDPVAV